MTLTEIASIVEGTLLSGPDSGQKEIRAVRSMIEAGPSDLTFLANPKYKGELSKVRAGAILLPEPVPDLAIPQVIVSDPYLALARIMQIFYPLPKPSHGIHPTAVVSRSAVLSADVEVGPSSTIADGVRIGPGTIIGSGVHIGKNALIGEQCLIYSGVIVREDSQIGNRVIVQPNAVIGSDGFGYAVDRSGHRHKIPQIGKVVLHDDVEIGANTTIDRATFGETVIGPRTKIDNLVQIAHNVRIGEDCVVVAQAGISGSSRLGHRVILAGQAGVVGHIEIGNDSLVGAQSGVAQSLPDNSRVSGSPAVPHQLWLRIQAILRDLPHFVSRVRALERPTPPNHGKRGENE
ncbi:MAG: UDP-3-O-(3-hydroxymyristoyl)glucosamine N-acyltransferase [Leptospirales bacterium]